MNTIDTIYRDSLTLRISSDGELWSSQRKCRAFFCNGSTFFKNFAWKNIQTSGQ